MATVRLDNVTKVFPAGKRVLKGVSLTVEEGEFLVLAGRPAAASPPCCARHHRPGGGNLRVGFV
ncbi:hypothetical protein [Micromonospora chersina]|uniref:hypothetical protein n=1 Tax=Micromonospora chersina TaxID=47854 RepID=UPI0033ECC168